jgi:hypothetical protein
MKSSGKMVLSRIYGHGRGWVFSKKDFIDMVSAENIDKALSQLTKEGKIRRIARGLYEYPMFSKLLDQELSSDMDKVAHALARKFNWHIQPSSDTALNLLGLSTQVPGRYVYLSNGPSRTYEILGTPLEFKHTALKESGFKYGMSAVIVQAFKALGKERITDEVLDAIYKRVDTRMCPKLLKDTKTTTTWIYELIKKMCKETNDA